MISDRKVIDWGIAIVGSVVLHAVIIASFTIGRAPKTEVAAPAASASAPAASAGPEASAPAADVPATAGDEAASAKGFATAGAKDVMDAGKAMSAGDFEQTARAVRPAKGASNAKGARPAKPTADKPVKPVADKPVKSADKPAKPVVDKPVPSTPGKVEWKTYEVQRNDSLTRIARRCGCTVQELAKANGLKPTQDLILGQKIKVPESAEK